MSQITKIIFLLLGTACLLPVITTPMALAAGIVFSLFFGNPWPKKSVAASQILLKLSVVGLGFGLSIQEVWTVGRASVGYTVVGITLTIATGLLLGRLLHIRGNTSALISCGTAICGGSAIAAMAPVIKAKDDETAVALATIFTLNAVALIVFPLVGHYFDLTQHQFGVWAGLAIHDTSSVVGAAASYGTQALDVGTTVKLTRAAWIAPIALGAGFLVRSGGKAKFPLFILGFVVAAALHSLVPQFSDLWQIFSGVARQFLVLTLFLVGAGISREVLQKIGIWPMLQGVSLWIIVSVLTLTAICTGLIA
ncbi:MAG: putative sulfate exporter family transporter [Deltaproteobacteria bacterium]|nr:MAG: putative sulfate exporter family transporter [Deltaproteobacteria bacterium]